MDVVIYARFSSDNQREASIEDQVRICTERARREGWNIVQVYADHAISGASLMRPAIQALLRDAQLGKFQIVLSEALDRLSRDQEDTASIYKRLTFADARIFTLSEGEISQLHVGLKGTMNALFLKDLADKTRRGIRGKIEKGLSGGGITYGYEVVRRIDPNSHEYARGERRINDPQAAIVKRIFREYLRGKSPQAISMQLNEEGVPCPSGRAWGPSTIYGNRVRGTGILNNELYIGQLVWNRLRYIKDPASGKRVSRMNPESEWLRREVPELRIIDQETWDAVKKLQGEYYHREMPLWQRNRPKHLLTGVLKCGCCGGGMTMMTPRNVACFNARKRGTCENRLSAPREEIEQAVLGALRDHLMDEQLCAEFCTEYTKAMNGLRMRHNAAIAGHRAEYASLQRAKEQIVNSILEGVPGHLLKDRAIRVQSRIEELDVLMAEEKEEQVLFHPNMSNRYQKEIRNLLASLSAEETRPEAAQLLRSLIQAVVLTPSEAGDRMIVDLVGDLAGILAIATKRDRHLIESDLDKVQPVQSDADVTGNPEKAKAPADRGLLDRKAMVAGTRAKREQHSLLTGRLSHLFGGKEALVAGARNHLNLHFLSTCLRVLEQMAAGNHGDLFRTAA